MRTRKPWYFSKTIIASFVTVAIAGAQGVGIDIPFANLILAITGGSAVAGRAVADRAIKLF